MMTPGPFVHLPARSSRMSAHPGTGLLGTTFLRDVAVLVRSWDF